MLEDEERPSERINKRQWGVVCYVEEFWCERKKMPTYQMIMQNVDGFKTELEVEAELYSPPVRVRLKNRGVNYQTQLKRNDPEYVNPSRLSDKQLAVINTLLNPFDRRSQSKKLAELGIGASVLHGWMKDKRFSKYYNDRAEELFGPEGLPVAHEALMRKVAEGNLGAIKLFYEVSGRHTGVNKQEVMNLKLMFARFTEILQRHISPDVMRLVINDLNNAMSMSGALDNQMALRASSVAESGSNGDDYSLEFE